MTDHSKAHPHDETTSRARRSWETPNVRRIQAGEAEIGLIDPAPEGTFGLS